MGDIHKYQELTQWDTITVLLYRSGVFLSTISLTTIVFLMHANPASSLIAIALILFALGTGLSVFFIHLYISRFKKIFMALYSVSLAGATVVAFTGFENLLLTVPGILFAGGLLASYSLIGAKEAFCFRLWEGYILFVVHLIAGLLLLFSAPMQSVLSFMTYSTVLALLFAVRKLPQPMHFDIGDKSQYR